MTLTCWRFPIYLALFFRDYPQVTPAYFCEASYAWGEKLFIHLLRITLYNSEQLKMIS